MPFPLSLYATARHPQRIQRIPDDFRLFAFFCYHPPDCCKFSVLGTRASVPDRLAALPSPRIQMPASGIRLPTSSSFAPPELRNTQATQVKTK